MRKDLYNNDNERIGYIENDQLFNTYNEKICNYEDGDFYDPITREIHYRIHDDGVVTEGTSNRVVGRCYDDEIIPKRENNYQGYSGAAEGYSGRSILGPIVFAIVAIGLGILIWYVVLSNMFDSASDSMMSGGVLFYHVACTIFIAITSVKKCKNGMQPKSYLPILFHILSYPYLYLLDVIVEGDVSSIFGMIFVCLLLGILPFLIQQILIWLIVKFFK